MGLDLMPAVWKSLVGITTDMMLDIRQADPLTYNYLKKIEMVRQ